jgi:hypothetical protein
MAAGRCISVAHRVHQATEEIPACMATGEAAGTAAALAASGKVDLRAVDVARLHAALEAGGAIVRVGGVTFPLLSRTRDDRCAPRP